MVDRWRFECPNGHSNIVAKQDGYRFATCGAEFEEKYDKKEIAGSIVGRGWCECALRRWGMVSRS